jgi:hypothetical protein
MSEPRTDAGRALLETVAHGGVKCGNESGWCHMSDVALLRKGLPTVEDEAAALERKTSIAAQEAINEIHMGIEAELMKQIAALREAARLPRNVLIYDGESVGDGVVFKGDWVAVPRADWNGLRAALTATEKHDV